MLHYLDQNGWAIVFGVLTPLTVALIRFVFAPKARVFAMTAAENGFAVKYTATQKQALLWTRTLLLRNTGRKEAASIEIALAIRPTIYKVWPPTECEDRIDPTGAFFIKIKRLPARAQMSVETLTEDFQPLLTNISHDGGTIHVRQANIYPVLRPYQNIIIVLCMIAGAMLLCYAIARLAIAGASLVGWLPLQ